MKTLDNRQNPGAWKAIGAAAVLFTLLAMGRCPAFAQSDVVNSVAVKIEFTGATPPQPLQDRIRNSVELTGRKALEGKTLAEAGQLRAQLEEVLGKIFNEVLSGFDVTGVTLDIGSASTITVRLEPDGARISNVRVFVEIPQTLHPVWNQLFQQSADSLGETLATAFAGVPVKSASWSSNLLRSMVENLPEMDEIFPGFEISSTLTVGETTKILLRLRASDTPVRSVSTSIRSITIPALLLDDLKIRFGSQMDFIVGLPLEFARRREAVLMREITRTLEDTGHKKRLYLNYKVRIVISRQSRVIVEAESTRFSGFLRGKVSLGKEQRNPDIEGHYGVFIHPRTEVFTEFNFYPGPVEMSANIGVGRRFSRNLYAAVGQNVTEGIGRAWASYSVTPDIQVSLERGVVEATKDRTEGALTFRAHEFFSMEMVSNFHGDIWLRFTANL